MRIEGMDYNTQREKLALPEYGREIQRMIDYAITLPTKEERQKCAETIVLTMERMVPSVKQSPDYKHKLWDHLALMSEFKLDIDWPYDTSEARKISTKPQSIAYPTNQIPARHYGNMMFEVFEKLKSMPEGPQRDELARITANQMKRCLVQWSHGSTDNEKVASDLAQLTDGVIQLNLSKFKFEKITLRDFPERKRKKK